MCPQVISDENSNWLNTQQRNVIKGNAFQILISKVLKIKKTEIVVNEQSIKKFVEIINNHSENLSANCYRAIKNVFVGHNINDLRPIDKNTILSYTHLTEESVFRRERETWSGDKVSKCVSCGNKLSKKYLKTKKCRKCYRGNFHPSYIYIKLTNKFKHDINILVEKNYFTQLESKKINAQRLDGWYYINEDLFIFETKNKEFTQLNRHEIIQTINYLRALILHNIKFNKIYLIYNGTKTNPKKLLEWLFYYNKKLYDTVKIIHWNDWFGKQNIQLGFNEIVYCKGEWKFKTNTNHKEIIIKLDTLSNFL